MLSSFIRLLTRCYRLALPYGRLKLFALLGLILFNGILQLIGVTSIFPFFALAADPDRLRNSKLGTWFLHLIPPMDNNNLLVVAGSFSILMLVIASLGSIASELVRIRYAYGFCHWLRRRLFESYAARPYGFFLRRNTAELGQKLGDVMTFIQNVLLPIGEILTRIVMVILLVGTVFLVQPWVSLGAVVILGGFYMMIFLWLRPRTREIGKGLELHYVGLGKNTLQFLHGIKPIFIHDKSRYFLERVMEHSAAIGRYQSLVPIYSNGPRYLIEPLAFGGLVAIVIVLALQGRPFSDILPNLSVMALAAYKLLPTLQLLYSQLVTIASNNYTLANLENEILEIEKESDLAISDLTSTQKLTFDSEVKLKNITFRYPTGAPPILKDLSLAIRKNESVGIAGPSGSGKSTLVDLIIGLHNPESGSILIDDVPLSRTNIASWRRMIGYVPQEIYLIDDSVAANIAFGIPLEEIDDEKLVNAAKGAQILDFIQKELSEGFQTRVGDRGVRLSGGQRQRLGLARALYHNPQVLILDEATSALDHSTEAAVMETIHKLQGTLTIITIAHRLTTLERCDRIIQL
jgi:ABC-type multidrug transport system fused ATPase/permease subunit